MALLPMFPLGTVLFPSAVLPLHVFEPRYRAMVRDCLAGERELGVVLIERGSEVGGDDVRSSVGTVARIVDARELPDGRWALVTVGARRLRVERWLPDDPYPVAEVADWPDPDPGPDLEVRMAEVVARLRTVLALASEAGDDAAPATIELSPDPVLAGHQAASVGPFGPLDRQRLLSASSPAARADLLEDLLADAEQVLRLRLAE
jgi:Lon protease-like protein